MINSLLLIFLFQKGSPYFFPEGGLETLLQGGGRSPGLPLGAEHVYALENVLLVFSFFRHESLLQCQYPSLL